MSIITDEMVETLYRVFREGGTGRQALESVANDLIEACAKVIDEIEGERSDGPVYGRCASKIRSLKSKG